MPEPTHSLSEKKLHQLPSLTFGRLVKAAALAVLIVALVRTLASCPPGLLAIISIPCGVYFVAVIQKAKLLSMKRARLEGELHVLQALRNVSGAVDGVDCDEMASTFLPALCRSTEAQRAMLMMVDEEEECAVVMGGFPDDRIQSASGLRLSLKPTPHGGFGASPVARSIASMQVVISPDIEASVEFVHWTDIGSGGTQVSLPVVTGSKSIGCVLLWFAENTDITEGIEVAQILVQSAAPVLSRLQPWTAAQGEISRSMPNMQLSLMDLISGMKDE